MSKLQDAGVKLYFISIGPAERGLKFHELTGFPKEQLLADPENVTYSALGFRSDTISAFFSPEVALHISITFHCPSEMFAFGFVDTIKPYSPGSARSFESSMALCKLQLLEIQKDTLLHVDT